jgi:hypothetical protein
MLEGVAECLFMMSCFFMEAAHSKPTMGIIGSMIASFGGTCFILAAYYLIP